MRKSAQSAKAMPISSADSEEVPMKKAELVEKLIQSENERDLQYLELIEAHEEIELLKARIAELEKGKSEDTEIQK